LDPAQLLEQAKKLLESGDIDPDELRELIQVVDKLEEYDRTAGLEKWFIPGSAYGIEKLPKHAAAIKATRDYRETLVLGGNRSGKTNLGCYITAVLVTGLYPDWWEGCYFDGPIDAWSMGMTAQTTRDTLQKVLLGEKGNFGTGMIPRSCIGRVNMSAVAGAVDFVKIKHTSGRWSEIGFKAYKQDTASFFGVKRHWAHLDEPCPELIYNEVVIRTAFEKEEQQGRIIHTITPKEGLTRLIADLLSTSDMLAGSEGLPNLKLAMALMKAEEGNKDD
jgi:phage terminase large subunit-like protein